MNDINNKRLLSKKHMQLEIELMINRELHRKNKINKEDYSKVELGILKDIESCKRKAVL